MKSSESCGIRREHRGRPSYRLALRRLATCWTTVDAGPGTDYVLRDNPLPEFIPKSLFQSLNTPDVQLRVPDQGDEALEIDTALREYSPGTFRSALACDVVATVIGFLRRTPRWDRLRLTSLHGWRSEDLGHYAIRQQARTAHCASCGLWNSPSR